MERGLENSGYFFRISWACSIFRSVESFITPFFFLVSMATSKGITPWKFFSKNFKSRISLSLRGMSSVKLPVVCILLIPQMEIPTITTVMAYIHFRFLVTIWMSHSTNASKNRLSKCLVCLGLGEET